MLYLRIATDLLTSLDELIALLDDDPVLVPALQRERSRLVNHLLGQLIASARSPARLPTRPPHRPQVMGGRRHIWSRFWRLRGASYRALAAGCLSSRRFDSLMLLALRGARRRGAQTSSSSPSPPESCEESAGAGAGPGAASGRGRTGWLMTGGCEPWPSRTKRIRDSTMRVCA